MVAADHRALGSNKSYPASQTTEGIWPPARTLRYDRQSPWLATGFDRRVNQTVTGVGVQNCAVSKRLCSAVDHTSRIAGPALSDKPDPSRADAISSCGYGGYARGQTHPPQRRIQRGKDVARLGVSGSCRRVLDAHWDRSVLVRAAARAA
ncbi:Conserved exported protein of unknown function [Mycobacterium canettii CIPT 140070010]|nr:Conserved exported protein of unknown function [Mycobacterium canettii CIPT 140070010]